MSAKTLKNPTTLEKEFSGEKQNKIIKVRVHIPKYVRNREEKINQIYDILSAQKQ